MSKTVILGTARTPFGKLGGALSTIPAVDLEATAIKAALERSGVAPEQPQAVIVGQVLQAGVGQIPSRQAQIKAGIPKEVPSETINKVCASGLRAVAILDWAIRAGDISIAVAGGMESMSRAPYLLEKARFGYRMNDGKLIDEMVYDGLTNPFTSKHMAHEATEVALELKIAREELDQWALRSHQRAVAAGEEGRFKDEIVEVVVAGKRGETTIDRDEAPRADTSLDALAKLPPIFVKDGTHTAGNSPGVNDGAAALVVASDDWAQANGRKPLAAVISQGAVADEFHYLARTPARAAQVALERAGLRASDIDLWEINEAFASVVLNSIRMLDIDPERVNVNGGAIALGHPIGASGARILGALIQELRRRGGGRGCAAICSGGGQGDAMIIEV